MRYLQAKTAAVLTACALTAGLSAAPAQAASSLPQCKGLNYTITATAQNTYRIHLTPIMTGASLKSPVSTVAVYEVNNLTGSRDTAYSRGLGVNVSIWRGWKVTALRVSVQDARISFANRYYVCPNNLHRR